MSTGAAARGPAGSDTRDVQAPPPARAFPAARGSRPGRTRVDWADVMLAGILASATLIVHDVGYLFREPFWNDEAWVAISTKLPLHDLPRIAASTPVGWSFLLRLVVVGGDQRLRVIPLLFGALAVAAAYGYVRSLPWPGVFLARAAAVLAGVATLATPSALVRNDLKQYTADAFVTVMILWLVSRLESHWSRRRLLILGVAVTAGFLFSAVAPFVGAASFAGVLLTALLRRNRLRAIEAAVVGATAGVVLLILFLALYRPGIPPGLSDYWANFYLPVGQGWGASGRFLLDGGTQMASYLGMGPLLLAALLVVAGVATLIRLRRWAVALVVPVLVVEMITASAVRQYPLFDLRTSHFLTTAFAVTAAVGVAGLAELAGRVHRYLAAAVVALAVTLFLVQPGVRSEFRSKSIPVEDVRAPTRYIAAHRKPTDVIVMNMNSNWGFAYYWSKGTPAIEPAASNLQGFVTVFPDQPEILVATDRTPAAVDAVLNRAMADAAKLGAGGRIWVVTVHVQPSEQAAFNDYPDAHGLAGRSIIAGSLVLLTPVLQ